MITPEEFVARWNNSPYDRPLVCPPPESVNPLKIPLDSKQFLLKAGLPSNPLNRQNSLSCDILAEGMKRLSDVQVSLNSTELDRYYLLGVWAGGNWYLCIDANAKGTILDLGFEEGNLQRIQFVNSSLPQLAECFLVYQELVDTVLLNPRFMRVIEKGEAYLPTGECMAGKFATTWEGEEKFAKLLKDEIKRIDAKVFQLDDEESFWPVYLIMVYHWF